VVAKVRERLAVNKQELRKFDVERLKLRQLRELEVRKQYQFEISNRFGAFETLNDSEDLQVHHPRCVYVNQKKEEGSV
jgi:hypothetical protein